MPLIVVNGQLPEQLQRTFTKLKTLIEKSSIVLAEADNLLEKVYAVSNSSRRLQISD